MCIVILYVYYIPFCDSEGRTFVLVVSDLYLSITCQSVNKMTVMSLQPFFHKPTYMYTFGEKGAVYFCHFNGMRTMQILIL